MITTNYRVTGMNCGHCEASIREEVSAVAGVEAVDVSASAGTLSVTSAADLDLSLVIAAVRVAGYTAEPLPAESRTAQP
ncbi:heavy-metal-associated domain-containing protein [Rhodococcus sp. G-MC3]|uniref:heavy-metal-associated domain-containing protein n=1 Tax=Rhodococcus sp. G-MC3 TaxID=3046209 RepID=UPI0024B9B22B|nr:heavy-metal-associated domain-containing protein [Rhodococcus sp. G-MC3]MDJ0394212.1 heavy-metal-associated domain-containing protein [Rhodococcus sp. G-MC3]